MSLVGTVLYNSTFVKDTNPNFEKIDNVAIGNSKEYGYKTITNSNIGALLAAVLQDNTAVCIVYDWIKGIGYIKSGFNMDTPLDSASRPGYTTFVIAHKIPLFLDVIPAAYIPEQQYPLNSIPLWNSSTTYNIGDTVSCDNINYTCSTQNSNAKPSDILWVKVGPTPIPTVNPITTNKLSVLLKGNMPLGVYFQSWSAKWTSDPNTSDLVGISNKNINVVYLSFATPACTYISGSNSFTGTGLQFSSDFSVVKSSINILTTAGIVVMISVGGATYPFDIFNTQNLANLCKDLGCNGIDLDWEDPSGSAGSSKLGPIINNMRTAMDTIIPNACLSLTGISVGAYGQGNFANATPASANTGMCIPGLVSNGKQIDWINIMSYDASPAYSPITGYDSYRSYYTGPICIGCEVPPEAWGGNVITLDNVKNYADYVNSKGYNGLFVWSYQKSGTPSCTDIINTAFTEFNSVPAPVPVPAPAPAPAPVPAPVPAQSTGKICAPFIDVGAWPPFDLIQCVKDTGNKYFSLAFVTYDGTGPSLAGAYPINDTATPWFLDKITLLRNNYKGDVIMSFGGAAGSELATVITDLNKLASMYQKVIDKYSLNTVSFDIEGGAIAQSDSIDRRNKAIVLIQKNNPNLKVHYVLPVMPDGLDSNGINLIKNCKQNNVKLDCVQLMAMDYGQNNKDLGKAAVSAAQATKTQLSSAGYPNCTIGIIPMIGQNDTQNEVFSLNNANQVLTFAKNTDYISLLSYWSIARDSKSTQVNIQASPSTSGIVQNKYDFINCFKQVQ